MVNMYKVEASLLQEITDVFDKAWNAGMNENKGQLAALLTQGKRLSRLIKENYPLANKEECTISTQKE